jgi:hypothetical protein
LAAADIVFLALLASSKRALISPALTLSLLTFLMIGSITGDVFAFPSLGFVMIALIHVPVLTEWNSRQKADVRNRVAGGDDIYSRSRVLTGFIQSRRQFPLGGAE